MKKKGFTLIELLAVIVILAVISLIATPMILNVIENAKKGSAEASANAYKEALTQLIAENEIKGVNKLQTNNTYYVTRGTTIEGIYYEAINDIIKIKGYKPTGYDDYIKFGKHYEIEEAVLTINGYEIKLENNKVVAVEKGEIIELEYITVTETETMERGASYTIETVFEPINTSDQRIKYTSSDNSIVTVDENGLVKAIKNGEAKITVTPLSNKSLKKEITITVISPSEVTGIKLNKESTTIGLGKSEDIIATLEPSDATSNALTWESNNAAVTVTDSGKITGTKLGTAIVTATTQSGLKASIEVIVEYQITLNDKKYYTTNDNITIDNVDTTNKTNISCNNGSIPSINGNNVTITNITSSVECVINDSLKETVDNIDSSLNNILMINDETNNNESIIINESKNINLDLNGKNITYISSEDGESLLHNNGNLVINDNIGTSTVKSNSFILVNEGNLSIHGGSFNATSDGGKIGGCINAKSGIVNVYGGNFISSKYYVAYLDLEAKDDTILNIYDGEFNSEDGDAIIVNKSQNGILNINDANIISNGTSIGIYNFYNGNINIKNSNIVTNKYGIYNESTGTVTINDTYIISNEYSALTNRGSGIINSIEGEYTSYASNSATIYNYKGIINLNNSRVVKEYVPAIDGGTWRQFAIRNESGTTNINGGEYISNASSAVYLNSTDGGTINIKGGIFKGSNNIATNRGTISNSGGSSNSRINICSATVLSDAFDLHYIDYGLEYTNSYIKYKSGINWSNGTTPSISAESNASVPTETIIATRIILDDTITCEG